MLAELVKFTEKSERLFEKNVSAKAFTTFGVGKGALFLARAKTTDEFISLLSTVYKNSIPFVVLGGGSNVIFPDYELEKLVIINESTEFFINGNEIVVSAGVPLATLINKTIEEGLSGVESLSGIPGTVGGAIVGNAGAYGQLISNSLISVDIFDGTLRKTLSKQECAFLYRDSIFKKEPWYVLSARFILTFQKKEEMAQRAKEIIDMRNKKYPKGLRCPGSFFKNVLPNGISTESLAKIDASKIKGGKIPAGYLLETVGAPGMKEGGISVANYHGNLFINNDTGTAHDVETLSALLAERVSDSFGIKLTPEVQFVK